MYLPTHKDTEILLNSLAMTRRIPIRPAEDVESQSREADTPDDSSQSPCTLPSYDDAVVSTSSSTLEVSETKDEKDVSELVKPQALELYSSLPTYHRRT